MTRNLANLPVNQSPVNQSPVNQPPVSQSLKPFPVKYFIKPIAYLLGIHLAALVLLTLMRVCFYLSVSHMLTPDVAGQPALVATAFVRGL